MRRFAVLFFSILGLGAMAPPAVAEHIEIETRQPDSVEVGEVIHIQAVVRSAETARRIAGATVVALRDASIAGVSGQVEVARAVSDENGIASLSWQVRGGSIETVLVAYSAPGEAEFESEPLSIITVGSGPQLARSTAGVRIPGLGAWMIIAVLVGIWAVIQFALIGPVQVARRAEPEDATTGEQST